MGIASMEGDTPTAPVGAPGKQRRRNRPQQASHDVADVVQAALVAKQCDEERALATQTRRRKRAFRKHKRTEQQTAGDSTDTATSTAQILPPLLRRDPVHLAGDAAVVVVVVENLVGPDELEDSDEYEDIVADLEKDFRSYGRLLSLETSRETGAVTLTYANLMSARTAVHEKHAKLFGGREVVARLVLAEERQQAHVPVAAPPILTPATQDPVFIPEEKDQSADSGGLQTAMIERKKKRRSKVKSAVLRERERSRTLAGPVVSDSVSAGGSIETTRCKFLVRNLITRDEMEDEDELAELQSDTRADFAAFGTLQHLEIVAHRGDDTVEDNAEAPSVPVPSTGDVVVEYEGPDGAASAFRAYDGKLFGGRKVECKWFLPTPPPSSQAATKEVSTTASHTIQVMNMLSPDELQDADEFEDLRDEVTDLFERHGAILALEICCESGAITVEYDSSEAAQRAVAKVNQSGYGGRCVEAVIATSDLEVGGQTELQRAELSSTEASKPDRPFAAVVRTCFHVVICESV